MVFWDCFLRVSITYHFHPYQSLQLHSVFLAVPLRKQTVSADYSFGTVLTLEQIIKEKLPFPSGTATAQLIGVMYRIPLRLEGSKNRHGYQAIDESHLPDDTEELVEGNRLAQDCEAIGNNGWKSLLWSFGASAFVTVGSSYVLFTINAHLIISYSPIFSLYICHPDLRAVPCKGMAMVVHTKSIICWPRCDGP